jgi:hypothetical protein
VFTAQDVVDYLMTATGGGAQDGEHRALRAAVHHAYRDLCAVKDWLWHTGVNSFTTVANQLNYDLPENVTNIDALLTPSLGTIHHYLSPQEWKRAQIAAGSGGNAFFYTVMRNDTGYQIRFVGQPTAGVTLDYTYRYRPSPLRLMGFEESCRKGTVNSSGTSVTGIGTEFPTQSVDAAIRFGTVQNLPESLPGMFPYQAEQKITARSSPTALTLQATAGTFSGVRYYISDILDVSPPMYTALLSGAELWLARLTGKPAEQPIALYTRDLRLAMEQDNPAPISGRRFTSQFDPHSPRSLGYYSPSLPDQG